MSTQLDAIIARYKKIPPKIRFKAYLKLTNAVLLGTPVDSGALRLSWTPSIGAHIATENIDPKGEGVTRHDYARVLNQLEGDDVYNLANGQPYARRIEFEGHSPQAPAGMMRIAAAKFQQYVEEAANET